MLDFDKYLMRHGEFWIQDIVERIERHEGLFSNQALPLETRWQMLMQASITPTAIAA